MTAHSNRACANRVNAKRSTGPSSEVGRRRASLNRLLHGLRASTPVLPGEDPNELDELVRKVTNDTQPQGVIERFMAERIALGMWRLRRAERAELGVLVNHLLTIEAKRADRDAWASSGPGGDWFRGYRLGPALQDSCRAELVPGAPRAA
jgi:hypothetical protein